MNYKLVMKVLNAMDDDMTRLTASLLNVKDEKTRIQLYSEIRELKLYIFKLKNHYQKVLNRTL